MNTVAATEVVITGVGVVSPVGIGRRAYWTALIEGHSGVRPLSFVDERHVPVAFGGEVTDFDPKQVIKPRKSLKVMSREIQLAIHAADLAATDAGLAAGAVDPDRLGVLLGADFMQCDPQDLEAAFRTCLVDGRFDFHLWGSCGMGEIFPLWLLRYLPNMPACHIAIQHDARGPCNTISLGEVSSLLAVGEAAAVIRRGQADVMLCGGTGSRIHPVTLARSYSGQISRRVDDPAGACRPFDVDRDGYVNGEGAAVFVLESRRRAEARGAAVLARILGQSSGFEPPVAGRAPTGAAIRRTIRGVLASSGLASADVGHVNAHGLGTTIDDQVEAGAIHDTLGSVPVTAPKCFFGNLGSGAGAVEMVASILALVEGQVPFTLNHKRTDPSCPIHVVRDHPFSPALPIALVLNQTPMGQAAALLLAGP